MRIQHNISALNAHRQLGVNNSAVAKNLEKLSSGFRINRAGDDAAGLAISEKMRGQIRGLEMAGKNAQDGVSLIQTAEGALQETHSILQRMRELSVQASNGTYEEGFDSKQINKEVTALKAEIDRISDSTHFNNQKLLDGSLGGSNGTSIVSQVDSKDLVMTTNDATKAKSVAAAIGAFANATPAVGDNNTYTFNYSENGESKSASITLTAQKNKEGKTVLMGSSGKEYALTDATDVDELDSILTKELAQTGLSDKFTITSDGSGAFTFVAKEAGADAPTLTSLTTKVATAAGVVTSPAASAITLTAGKNASQETLGSQFTVYDAATAGAKTDDSVITINGKKFAIAKDAASAKDFGSDVNVAIGATFAAAGAELASMVSRETGLDVSMTAAAGATGTTHLTFKDGQGTAGKGGITFQIGANGTKDDRVSLAVANQDTKTLGIASIDLSTQDGANAAITLLDDAINSVSSTRADLGALQNRLEHTINNLGTSVENLTASESRIRDVDMAKEMMEMTKNNILTQAAQSMLAQANTQPQGVLQLLQ